MLTWFLLLGPDETGLSWKRPRILLGTGVRGDSASSKRRVNVAVFIDFGHGPAEQATQEKNPERPRWPEQSADMDHSCRRNASARLGPTASQPRVTRQG